jgi:folate-dependent phosphoribosylglycinamide formyltransferase PurN
MTWVAMFSHTGTDILNVSKQLSIYPDLIVTNNQPGDPRINKHITDRNVVYTANRPSVEDYTSLLDGADIVTLHGWMRIIPKSTCKQHNIYNLHPGLITEYPELKGADPQSRIYNQIKTYKRVGCVIHQVTDQLDGGQVMMERSTINDYHGEGQLTEALHKMGSNMWVDFLIDKL